MKPQPLTDLFKYLRDRKLPLTEANVRQHAKMLSFTDGELVLALALVRRMEAMHHATV